MQIDIDVAAAPFSRFGSYIAFNVLPPSWGHTGLILRSMRGVGVVRETFRLAIVREGAEIPYRVRATPARCVLEVDGAAVELCLAARDLVRLRATGGSGGATLRLISVTDGMQSAFPAGPNGEWQVNCPDSRVQYLFAAVAGRMRVEALPCAHGTPGRGPAPVARPHVVVDFVPGRDGHVEGAILELVTTPRPLDLSAAFEDCVAAVEEEWGRWLAAMPAVPPEYEPTARTAMYVNWSSVVEPHGNLRRPTMLMSKNWMCECWSWDHCFTAMALASSDPALSWDQFMVPFDLQDKHGALPDGMHSEGMGWAFCKPPIHGWALGRMVRSAPALLTHDRLAQIYPRLAAWTRWWLERRDYDADGLPEYHHGNDSGWDNASVFDDGFPVAAPDLSAYLVLQMDTLADLAGRLGQDVEATHWRARADRLLQRLMERLWNGEQFVTRRAFTGEIPTGGDSLLNYMPIVLGERLPSDIAARLAEALSPSPEGGRFVTVNGPATESPRSPLYSPDGYWRGPIWGPTTLLVVDGLWRAGFVGLAREIARRYCDMCRRCGMLAENYNALTGEPLRDKAYTWGASVYLLLAHEFLSAGPTGQPASSSTAQSLS